MVCIKHIEVQQPAGAILKRRKARLTTAEEALPFILCDLEINSYPYAVLFKMIG
jgi:hypothetical protein